ncbi:MULTISPECIES: hypothetical protein [Legionella]|uniref:Uncharacterized protein n=1 Tax=Legionella quinlivanii TaxID=45073 RepID=A0A364LHU0_9GAMM|nr:MULTISPECIES: hypothetical protein [Legionella]MCE3043581.1 hypothetical protein [Legionella sp. 16cNR16C]RAP35683.1 hypothetical protein B1207_11355 [Legionella quinlivanii]
MARPPHSKWLKIKEQTEAENNHSPVDTDAEIKSRFLDTQAGSPVDTTEELDAQENNLGPEDSRIETAEESSFTIKP